MVDTIRANLSVVIDTKSLKRLKEGDLPDWTHSSQSRHSGDGRPLWQTTRDTIIHQPTDLRIVTDSQFAEAIEVSLPKLLHGSNGILIKTPDELQAAVGKLLTLLHTFLPNVAPNRLTLTRIDLALNLPLDPRILLSLHRQARHPRIQRETEEYINEPTVSGRPKSPYTMSSLNTVRLNGTKTTIQLYNKVAEVFAKRRKPAPPDHEEVPPCTRVEIQLRGRRHIADLFDLPEPEHLTLDRLEFAASYRLFRSLLLGFDPVGAVPQFKANVPNLLAILSGHPETWRHLGGLDPLAWYRIANDVDDRQFRKMRREVHQAELTLTPFCWSDHLPPDRLPDVVDVDPEGCQTLIRSPWRFVPEPPVW